MPAINTDAIQDRQAAALALLSGAANDEDHPRLLDRLVEEDVPALLLELEARARAADEGYVRGLRAAATWLRYWDQDLSGFDRATCRNLATGMAAMAAAAQDRLGVDPDRPDDHEVIAAHAATLQEANR